MMRESEAVALIGLLAAYFPSQTSLPDETIAVYAREMLPFAQQAGQRAVETLGRSARWFPPLADLLAETRHQQRSIDWEAQRALPQPQQPAGVTFAEYLAAHPEARALLAGIGRDQSDGGAA